MSDLVLARVETIAAGDRVRTPKGALWRVDRVGIVGDIVTIYHERGTFAPMRRGERWAVQRAATPLRRRAPGGSVGEGVHTAAPAAEHAEAAAAPSPISATRARTLAMVLCGFRWPGGMPAPESRRARAAEQVARNALESLAVVE